MQIKCGSCGKDIIVPDDLVVGQHVRCPYCNEKSAFDKPSRVVLPTEIRPILQHVQPSGRGMQSEHELEAKRAAVESIEKRIDHNEKVRKSAARKRAAANAGSLLVGLVVLVGIACYFMRDGNGLGQWSDSMGIRRLSGFLFSSNAANLSGFSSVAREFAKGDLAHWKDAPKELNPKYAPKGTVYHALVPNGGKYALYELKANGAVTELSPFGDPLKMTMNDFKQAVGDKPYFIACEGRVFACGGGDLRMMDELRKALLPRDAERRLQKPEPEDL